MLILRVQVNEEPPVTGGANDLGVLNAIITAVGKLGDEARPGRPDEPPDIHLSLGGLTSRAAGAPDEHVRWVGHRELRVGDRVVVEVLEATSADPIESGYAARQREDDEREYFEHSRRAYFELKSKYEPEGSP
ncbi:MAG: hypothetical protein JO369_05640 [Paucibacter sp.]|nr:hypothetical protein [Roseateles sp.]